MPKSKANTDYCTSCFKATTKQDSVSCALCKQGYHFNCVGLNSKLYLKLAKETVAGWKCPTCTNVGRRKGSNLNSPVGRLLDDSIMSCDESTQECNSSSIANPCIPPMQQSSSSSSPATGALTLDGIAQLLDSRITNLKQTLFSEMRSIVQGEINTGLDRIKAEFTETTDFLAQEQNDIKGRISSYESQIKNLEQQNCTLQGEINTFKRRLESIEKISRNNNVEIQAVPEKSTENVLTIVKSLYGTVNLSVSDSEISACRRVAKMSASSSRPRNILVTLPSVRHRDNLISAVKRYNKTHSNDQLNSQHLGITGEKGYIYVAEHLSPESKELHAATRQAARGRYKYVWVKFGNIYVRKDDNSPAILIKNKECLQKLL